MKEKLKKFEKEIKTLTEMYNNVEDEKKRITDEANKTLQELIQKQAEINTSVVKTQGKIELIKENEKELKNITPKK